MNYILKYTGTTNPDVIKVTAILDLHEAQIIDHSLMPKTALVELDESRLKQLQGDLDTDWEIVPEKIYQVPDTKKKIRKS